MRTGTQQWIGGIILGSLLPIIAFFITHYTDCRHMFAPQKQMGFYWLAAAINLIGLRFIYRAGYSNLAKAILFATFVCTVLFLFIYKNSAI